MTDSVTIGGLHYLAGQTVSAFIAGLDCGDYIVDNFGQIVVPVGADPDGLFGPTYLSFVSDPGAYGDLEIEMVISEAAGTFTVNVPAVIGITYTSRGQILRPVTPDEIKSSKGPGLGKRKRAHMIGALLHNTAGVSFGTDFDNLIPASLQDDNGMPLQASELKSGVHWDTLLDDYTFDTMIAWEVTRPYSCVVAQLGAFLSSEDE